VKFGSNGSSRSYLDQTMLFRETHTVEPANATSPEAHSD
jgi:hypothetical protein